MINNVHVNVSKDNIFPLNELWQKIEMFCDIDVIIEHQDTVFIALVKLIDIKVKEYFENKYLDDAIIKKI